MQNVTVETPADEVRSFDDYRAVAEALEPYIEAAKTGDGDQSRTAFYDHAHIVGSVNGDFLNMDADSFKDALDVLYEQNGQWKISGKVYDSHAKN